MTDSLHLPADPALLSEALLNAPAWARVGLTMPDERMRAKAATELANTIVERLTGYPDVPDPDQLSMF
ncbi:DUF6771 family protein [Novosphingobium sp. TCA1]|jgi:hypothetical protein|uniref:DUF6771 family protein n=1 Tax=Novosphingobium sp. TCA1 TaxID=2682474 RepID=UPI0027BAB7CD|nr:DUF6771 family protein [Novosphingobium sp. TCA1]